MSKKTLKTAKETSNEAIVQVKENQKKLLRSCEQTMKEAEPTDASISYDKARNRQEKRIVRVFDTLKHFDEKIKEKWQEYITAIVHVTRIRKEFDTKRKQWKDSSEESYYVSTVLLSAKEYDRAVRRHWWIENKNHYVRDVSMNEDKSRIRVNPDIFVKLRSFALNIMRVNGEKNIKNALYENALNLEKVFGYECMFD